MKKNIYIAILFIFSLVLNILNVNSIFNDTKLIIQILLNILGLALTAYTFIFMPIQNTLSKHYKEKIDAVTNLLKEYKDNMLFIFWSSICLIMIEIILSINIPFIDNPTNIDFGSFQIVSLKQVFFMSIQYTICVLSIYIFYDLMKATFIIIEYCLKKSEE